MDVDSKLMDLTLLKKKTTELDVKYYTCLNYTDARRLRLMLFDSSIKISTQMCDALLIMRHNLEIGVFNYAWDTCSSNGHMPSWNDYRFCRIYEYGGFKIQKLIQSRPDIVTRLLSGNINPLNILYLSIHELLLEKQSVWDIENTRKKQTVIIKVTSDYPCPRCGARSAVQIEVQTRGCDEATTSKFTCQKCNKKWKEDD